MINDIEVSLISFVYRTDVFEKIDHVTYPDEGDKFEREPEIGLFTLKGYGKFQKLEKTLHHYSYLQKEHSLLTGHK